MPRGIFKICIDCSAVTWMVNYEANAKKMRL